MLAILVAVIGFAIGFLVVGALVLIVRGLLWLLGALAGLIAGLWDGRRRTKD